MSGRLVLASNRAVPGGAQLTFALLAPELMGLGWDVAALVGESGPLVEAFEAGGIPTTLSADAGALTDLGADLVISVGAAGHGWSGAAAAVAEIPAAWWLELTLRGRPAEAEALSVPAIGVATLTEAAAEALRLRAPELHVEPIAPAVRPGPVELHRARAGELRAAHGIDPATTLLVMVARIDPIKGQDLAIEATATLLEAGRDVHLALVGGAVVGHEGDLAERLERQVADLGIKGRVTFTGHVDDTGPWHAATDIAVHVSAHEAFGMSLVEALAHGASVIASATDGPRSILDDGRFGVLTPPGDVDALGDAIADLLDDPARVAELAAAGPERATRFTPKVAAARWDALLRRVAPTSCVPAD